jgi:PAS domain S-box-containing protein
MPAPENPIHPQMVAGARPPRRAALRITLSYILFGAAWILFSDWVLAYLVSPQHARLWHLQTVKGWVFIAVTAILLYVLIRRAYTALRISAQQQRETKHVTSLLVERVRDYAFFTLDDAGKVNCWNRGAEQLTQWSEAEISGRPLSVLYPPEGGEHASGDADERAGRDLDLARMRGWAEEEAQRVRRDGSRFWASTQLIALRDESDRPAGFICVLRDISERRRNQQALRAVNQTLRTIIDSSPLAIVTLDERGDVTSWNAAAEQMFGYSSLEVVGKPLPMVPPDRRSTLDENNRKLMAGQRLAAMEVVGLRKSGERIEVGLWAAPLTDERGRVAGTLRLYADISARKHAEEEVRQLNIHLEHRVRERTARLEETNEELQAFSYTVSHDLRQPLRSLQQLAKGLLENKTEALDEQTRGDTARIVGAAARMDRQIADLLEYSRVSRSELKSEPVSLVLIIHEMLGRLERDPAFKDARITVREPLGWVLAHRLTLQRVIFNVLTNAITFVAPGKSPSVTIWSEQTDQIVRLCIQDNGIGIDIEDRERIFQVFERLPAADHYPGIGVGLTVARRGVQRMGGTITYAPAPGGGTLFTIELPRAEKAGIS